MTDLSEIASTEIESPNGVDREAPLVADSAPEIDLNDAQYYLNRELSLLAFQWRVLQEAFDERNPLLERIKFLAIVSSNMDEFFMVRVAGLQQQLAAGVYEMTPDGLSPAEQLAEIRKQALKLMTTMRECLRNELVPALRKHGIYLLDYAALGARDKRAADRYFSEMVFPVLTPLAFDPGHPFPHISNLSLNLAVMIRDRHGKEHFARVKVPSSLPRLINLTELTQTNNTSPETSPTQRFVWVEQLIAANLHQLFPGMEVLEAHPFRVTRDADFAIQDIEADDLLDMIEQNVRQRRFGSVVRVTVNEEMPGAVRDILIENLELERNQVYTMNGPLGLSSLMTFYRQLDRGDLKDAGFTQSIPAPLANGDDNIFTTIRREDILLHHPYDSFAPVVQFLRAAATDPNVLAIKMTLYRVGRNSPVVEALLKAVENGKQVAVLVELKARFDEESNIEWAKRLESEGVHVIYGLVGLKTHSKIALVVRREGDSIRRYMHLATGNYNAVTATLYTDLGYFTCDEDLGADASDLFNFVTGYSDKRDYRKLLVAPINLREKFEMLIDREIEHVQAGRGGHLIFKMNALVDKGMIKRLYRASQAGVKIDLLVRGVCCLRPGIAGVSENITVTSVVGRFLEHSRIYYFHNAGKEEIYLGSADLMPRNLNRRVETVFPVNERHLIRQIRDEVLRVQMADTAKARRLTADGTYDYVQPAPDGMAFDSQAHMIKQTRQRAGA